MTSRVVHFRFGAVDADRLAGFYKEVFGWTIQDARLTTVEEGIRGAYRFISSDEVGLSGGVTELGPKGVVLTVEVDDLVGTLERVERLGGRRVADVEAERLRLEGAGEADDEFVCHEFVDPEGNRVQILKH